MEYNEALDELQELLATTKFPKDASAAFERFAGSVEPVKLSAPETKSAPPSAQLQEALEHARSVTAELGLTAPEAKLAWETVEEIAAAGNSNALGGKLSDEECFVEAVEEACAALEELSKIVNKE